MKKKPPFIVAISGVGGAGKNSILEVFKKYPDKFAFFVSYTDRPQRGDDILGESYHFISKEEFSEAIKNNEFMEWEQVRGEYRYGRKKADFQQILNSGKIPVMNIEVLGAEKFKKLYKLLSFFILPPSREEAISRMTKRGTDTPEAIKHRIDRYDLELSYKDKYDHTIINDDLQRAQKEVIEIIKKEEEKNRANFVKNIYLISGLLLLLGGGFYYSYFYNKNQVASLPSQDVALSPQVASIKSNNTSVAETPANTIPSPEVKKKILQSPPQSSIPKKNIVEGTKKNNDGSVTTTIATSGSANTGDLARAASAQTTVNTPYDISFRDETGQHADLGQKLKDYMNSQLKWRNEISSMKEITLRDAGESGWNGQYLGQYSSSPDGKDIVSASGTIILNSYYYKNSSLFDDYMKLFLSHEYGHHYTLYHKWVDWDMPAGTRFPDSYYAVRPLPKSGTATDYSLGWKNCDVEIIAEDYSYLYSGYGLDAMSSAYGFPSVATKTWLDNIGSPAEKDPVINTPPTLEITSPSQDATVTGQSAFQANASDDLATPKVSFYIGDILIGEDTSAPYEATINSKSYSNGNYVLKAIASDGVSTTETTINVVFQNDSVDLEKPAVSIIAPSTNPYTLDGNELNIRVVATDNIAVDKIEFYFEDTLQGSWKSANLNLRTSFASVPAGTYTLKFKAYDTAGNFAETTLTIVKP